MIPVQFKLQMQLTHSKLSGDENLSPQSKNLHIDVSMMWYQALSLLIFCNQAEGELGNKASKHISPLQSSGCDFVCTLGYIHCWNIIYCSHMKEIMAAKKLSGIFQRFSTSYHGNHVVRCTQEKQHNTNVVSWE